MLTGEVYRRDFASRRRLSCPGLAGCPSGASGRAATGASSGPAAATIEPAPGRHQAHRRRPDRRVLPDLTSRPGRAVPRSPNVSRFTAVSHPRKPLISALFPPSSRLTKTFLSPQRTLVQQTKTRLDTDLCGTQIRPHPWITTPRHPTKPIQADELSGVDEDNVALIRRFLAACSTRRPCALQAIPRGQRGRAIRNSPAFRSCAAVGRVAETGQSCSSSAGTFWRRPRP